MPGKDSDQCSVNSGQLLLITDHSSLLTLFYMPLLRLIIFAALLIILSIVTIKRNHIWQNDIAFWSDVAIKSPGLARPHNNMGNALISVERCDDAIPPLLLSIKADPLYIEPHSNIAMCYVKKGRFDDAIPKFEEVLRINAVLKKGHYGVQAVLKLDLQAHSNLGNIYNIKGMTDKAIFHYKEALNINPKDTSTRFNLAMTYEAIGMLKEAIAEFEGVLKTDHADEGARRGVERLARLLH